MLTPTKGSPSAASSTVPEMVVPDCARASDNDNARANAQNISKRALSFIDLVYVNFIIIAINVVFKL
jgi:hypothetical protein